MYELFHSIRQTHKYDIICDYVRNKIRSGEVEYNDFMEAVRYCISHRYYMLLYIMFEGAEEPNSIKSLPKNWKERLNRLNRLNRVPFIYGQEKLFNLQYIMLDDRSYSSCYEMIQQSLELYHPLPFNNNDIYLDIIFEKVDIDSEVFEILETLECFIRAYEEYIIDNVIHISSDRVVP